MTKFDALIFDCDGVLVDSEVIAIQCEREILAGWGLDYPFETFVQRFVGLHNRDFHNTIAADAQAAGLVLPDDFRTALHANHWKRFEAELKAIDGVLDVVAAFPGLQAVASSSEADKLVRKLELTGLHETFAPHVYSSDLVANGKPAPDLFLLTADRREGGAGGGHDGLGLHRRRPCRCRARRAAHRCRRARRVRLTSADRGRAVRLISFRLSGTLPSAGPIRLHGNLRNSACPAPSAGLWVWCSC